MLFKKQRVLAPDYLLRRWGKRTRSKKRRDLTRQAPLARRRREHFGQSRHGSGAVVADQAQCRPRWVSVVRCGAVSAERENG